MSKIDIYDLDAKLHWLLGTDPEQGTTSGLLIDLPAYPRELMPDLPGSQNKLAEILNVAASTLSGWRSPKDSAPRWGQLPLEKAIKISQIFGFPPPVDRDPSEYWKGSWPSWKSSQDASATGDREDSVERFARTLTEYIRATDFEPVDDDPLKTNIKILKQTAQDTLDVAKQSRPNRRCQHTAVVECISDLIREIDQCDATEIVSVLQKRREAFERIRKADTDKKLYGILDGTGLNVILLLLEPMTTVIEVRVRELGRPIANEFDEGTGELSQAIDALIAEANGVLDRLAGAKLRADEKLSIRAALQRVKDVALAEELDLKEVQALRAEIESLRAKLDGLEKIVLCIELVAGKVPDNDKRHKDIFRDHAIAPSMVVIDSPDKRFLMGAAEDEAESRDSERPQHEVVIAKKFALGRYTVSFEEYGAYCEAVGINLPDDEDWGRGHMPVINVSWDDAQKYFVRLHLLGNRR